MRHIVMISQIPLWSMGKAVGGPAFHQTVTGLAKRFRITLVQPRLGYVDPEDLPRNVTLRTFDHHLHGLWRSIPKIGWVTDTIGWYTFQWSAWPVVRDVLENEGADLIYGYEIYGTPVARRAADRARLPMVSRFQGTLMTERQKMPLARIRFHKHVAGLSVPADLVIMTNDGTLGRDYLLELGHPAEKIRFWMNGVDRSIMDSPAGDVREELGIPAGAPVLLTVSRLSFWKRVDRAVRLVGELKRRNDPSYLVIVGTGHEERALRELCEREDVRDRVILAGAVARDDLASYYATADLLLSLYDFSNLSNPVIEAMLLGTPLLAYDIGGTADLVHDGVNGVLTATPDDTPALADTVQSLLTDEARLRQLGSSARRWAQENLMSWDERIAMEADALDSLIGQHDGHKGQRSDRTPRPASAVDHPSHGETHDETGQGALGSRDRDVPRP